MKKIFSIFLVVFMLTFTCMSVYAIDVVGELGGDITPTAPGTDDKAQTMANDVLGAIQWVGIAIAVGMIIFAGIKYVMSGAGEKAKVKEQLVPLLIGAILIGGATTVANIIFNIAK